MTRSRYITPVGLPASASQRLRQFDARRMRFYTLSMTFLVLVLPAFLIVAVVYPADAIEARLPWLSAVMALLLPGLPTLVLEFAEKYPWLVFIVGGAIWLLRRAGRVVKEAAQEYAFQAWRRTTAAGPGQVKLPMPPNRGLLWAPPWNATVVVITGLVVLLVVNVFSPQDVIVSAAADLGACDGVRGECWLGPGESVMMTLRADQPRNETGVLLEAGRAYQARFVGRTAWRDGEKIQPAPEGFQFDADYVGITKYWWLRWRRPLPEGRWFEVVGRIDREPQVFSVLDAADATRPFSFTAPHAGELVLFVNDVPYGNNSGAMTVEISRR